MESCFTAFSTTTTTSTTITHLMQSNMDCTQNSQFSICETISAFSSTSSTPTSQFCYPAQYMPPFQSLQFPFAYPFEQAGQSFCYPAHPFSSCQNGIEFGVPSSIQVGPNSIQVAGNGVRGRSSYLSLSPKQERRTLDPYRTKVARIKRKLARQRSLSLSRSSSSGASSSIAAASSTQENARRLTMYVADTDVQNSTSIIRRDLYQFCTPDNKRLRVLVIKELKNSDVGSLGRIVLPKREAEENLPFLSDKEGIQVMIRDVYSTRVWTFRYKFWSNNKSRMYVIENTGNSCKPRDFVKQNGLESGDYLTLFEDESKNLYFSIRKVQRQAVERAQTQHYLNHNHNHNYNYNYLFTPFNYQAREEEESSLALDKEQLKHKEQQKANYYDHMNLPMDGGSSKGQPNEVRINPSNNVITSTGNYKQLAAAAIIASSSRGKVKGLDDDQEFNFDECYRGLGMLPDVNRYNFSF